MTEFFKVTSVVRVVRGSLCEWEDAGVWVPGSCSFDLHLGCLGPVLCLHIPSFWGLAVGSGCQLAGVPSFLSSLSVGAAIAGACEPSLFAEGRKCSASHF